MQKKVGEKDYNLLKFFFIYQKKKKIIICLTSLETQKFFFYLFKYGYGYFVCRWYTYLNSDFKRGGWSPEEDMLLCEVGFTYKLHFYMDNIPDLVFGFLYLILMLLCLFFF